jgi:hypothetical protein
MCMCTQDGTNQTVDSLLILMKIDDDDAMQCVVFSFLSELKEGKKDSGSDFNSFSQEIKKTIFCAFREFLSWKT